ncbi:MAG: copper chaperone PCu(A)C [Spirochaetota bacterium]|nr:copper chaperone PCu(A)C [Spirochaetota bacterium]
MTIKSITFVFSIILGLSIINCGGTRGAISVEKPWIVAVPEHSRTTAAYMTLHNKMPEGDVLLSVETDIAKSVELHNIIRVDGKMRMRQVSQIKIPAKGSTTLKRGGLHLMLIGLLKPVKEGDTVTLILNFKNAGKITTMAQVGKTSAKKSQHHHHHH